MALGGGTWTTQNKDLPGSYINFISLSRADGSLSERGTAAMPFVGDWGPEDQVIELTPELLQKQSLSLLGYPYTHPEMTMFREIFRGASRLYAYRLNSGAAKAGNALATARYGGTRGNAITITVQPNVDDPEAFDVRTLLDMEEVDAQTVKAADELTPNDYVDFKADATLTTAAGVPLSGGTDGTGRTGQSYQRFLDKIEAYSFHALGCNTGEKGIIDLFVAFTKRMRDEVGAKFQTVVYRAENADHEGVVSVENKLLDVDENLFGEFSLTYWATGIIAGCAVNESNQNRVYDGEYTVDTAYTQAQLAQGIREGKFLLHQVGAQVRVLADINTLVTLTESKGAVFRENQTIRVIDQIGNDIAVLFNTKYQGYMPNDASGRISLWADITAHHRELEKLRAIQEFSDSDVAVEPGDTPKSVLVSDRVQVVNAMAQLYMTCVVA